MLLQRSGGRIFAAGPQGEVIPLRERGKYQGALGAVFGVLQVALGVEMLANGWEAWAAH